MAEEIARSQEDSAPNELSSEIKGHVATEWDLRYACGDEGDEGESEAVRYLGYDEYPVFVPVKYLRHLLDLFFGQIDIFSESSEKPPPEMMSDVVPRDIADEVADHESDIHGKETEISAMDEDTEEH
jgi:hypothetical protein